MAVIDDDRHDERSWVLVTITTFYVGFVLDFSLYRNGYI